MSVRKRVGHQLVPQHSRVTRYHDIYPRRHVVEGIAACSTQTPVAYYFPLCLDTLYRAYIMICRVSYAIICTFALRDEEFNGFVVACR
jgi:hypothetical protein